MGLKKKEKKKEIVRQGGHAQLEMPEESDDPKTRRFLSATNWQITSRVHYPATRSACSVTHLHSSSSLPHGSRFESVWVCVVRYVCCYLPPAEGSICSLLHGRAERNAPQCLTWSLAKLYFLCSLRSFYQNWLHNPTTNTARKCLNSSTSLRMKCSQHHHGVVTLQRGESLSWQRYILISVVYHSQKSSKMTRTANKCHNTGPRNKYRSEMAGKLRFHATFFHT